MFIYLKLIKESILFAFHALSVNKLRTFLSLLGITIGIFTIILVFTVVDSLEKNVRESVESLGDNVIYVQKWPWAFGSDYPWWKYWQRPLPDFKEMEQLQERTLSAAAMTYTASLGGKTIKHGSSSIENIDVVAVSHDFDQIKSFELATGRYFTEQESAGGRPIAIIGSEVNANLFENSDPIGKEVLALGRKFIVIGVFAKEGSSIMGSSLDNTLLIPVNFARNIMNLKSDRIQPMIQVKGNPGVTNAELSEDLRGVMRSVRRLRPAEEDDFALNESKLLSNQIGSLFDVIGVAGWIIGGFSILVGGFGIANIMFVSVRERTNQIGIQKSLGAKKYFILVQFLSEAVTLCIIGGAIGLLLVFLIAEGASSMLDFDLSLSFTNIVRGFIISAIIGIISGFIPAYTASKLDPVEAIRSNG
ncbi:MAG: ABC transporter permease [Bacteroidetes bacterium]|nr:ABC transporter permease [Bacteroidota bacterium]